MLPKMRIASLPLEDFLVFNEDIRMALQSNMKFLLTTRTKKPRVDAQLKEDHLYIYNKLGLAWPPPVHEYKWTMDADHLTQREKEVIYCVVEGFPVEEDGCVFMDCNTSLRRLLPEKSSAGQTVNGSHGIPFRNHGRRSSSQL